MKEPLRVLQSGLDTALGYVEKFEKFEKEHLAKVAEYQKEKAKWQLEEQHFRQAIRTLGGIPEDENKPEEETHASE